MLEADGPMKRKKKALKTREQATNLRWLLALVGDGMKAVDGEMTQSQLRKLGGALRQRIVGGVMRQLQLQRKTGRVQDGTTTPGDLDGQNLTKDRVLTGQEHHPTSLEDPNLSPSSE